ncbi:hypothetical protein TNCV_4950041 [Trichonephila clavipes]|nr:hypothetical protein TNCV_4950041 [Trichonephila clavipes]
MLNRQQMLRRVQSPHAIRRVSRPLTLEISITSDVSEAFTVATHLLLHPVHPSGSSLSIQASLLQGPNTFRYVMEERFAFHFPRMSSVQSRASFK